MYTLRYTTHTEALHDCIAQRRAFSLLDGYRTTFNAPAAK